MSESAKRAVGQCKTILNRLKKQDYRDAIEELGGWCEAALDAADEDTEDQEPE